MALIESGRIVKIEVTLKVPVGMPPGIDPRLWAIGCVTLNLEAVREFVSMNALLGQLQPASPPILTP